MTGRLCEGGAFFTFQPMKLFMQHMLEIPTQLLPSCPYLQCSWIIQVGRDTADRAEGIKKTRVCIVMSSHTQNLEKIRLVYGMLCNWYTTYTRSINSARQFTWGAAKGKQSSGVYTLSIGYHIETVNYNSVLCKLFCTSCKFCANYYCTIFT